MIAKIDNAVDYSIILMTLSISEVQTADDPVLSTSYRIIRERLMESHDEILRESALKDRDPDTGAFDPADDLMRSID
jgi:hypothetical protein